MLTMKRFTRASKKHPWSSDQQSAIADQRFERSFCNQHYRYRRTMLQIGDRWLLIADLQKRDAPRTFP
jgi:hypothetical protein